MYLNVRPHRGRITQWGALLAILLLVVGCAFSNVAARLAGVARPADTPGSTASQARPGDALAAALDAQAPAAYPGALPAGKGLVALAIRWPDRATQVIPASTSRVLLDAFAGGALVASASIDRPPGAATSTASWELDPGSYRVDATAETASGSTFITVATASTPFTVVAGARTAVTLALGATYRPAVTSLDWTWGLPGDSVTLGGSGLSLSWAAQPAVAFAGDGSSVPATVTAVTADSVTVTVPAGALTGPISVVVDGVATSSPTFTVPSPALWALGAPIASAGDTLYLEGGFGRSATVAFPGDQTANAEVLGPGRARVVVPAGTTAGDLTVTTGGVQSAPLAFRAPTFSLGLGTLFGGHYDQAGGGLRMPSLVTARRSLGSAVVGKYLYVLGGNDGSSLASVERATLDAAGHLGPFATVDGVTLRTAREYANQAVVGGYLYVFGGITRPGDSFPTSVERAAIDGSGNLANFENVSGSSLAAGRYCAGSAVIGRYLYVFGGGNAGGYLGNVERAPIDAAGNVGPFAAVADVNLGTARYMFGSAVIGNYLYVLGGFAGGTHLASIERAPIDPAGQVGPLQDAGVALAAPRRLFGTAQLGRSLFVFGGEGTGEAITGTVERAPIDTSGNLGAFAIVSGTTQATPRRDFSAAKAGTAIYVLGGETASGKLATVERIGLNASGGLTTFETAPVALTPGGRDGLASALVGSRVFAFGGYRDGTGYLGSVEQADVNPAGELGAFTTSAATMAVACYGHKSAVLGSYVYLTGGKPSTGAATDSVQRAAIGSDGDLGSFAPVNGVKLVGLRYSHGQVVVGNYLYVIGGTPDGNAVTNSVQRAAIGAGGDLTSTFTDAGVTLQTARYNHATAVVGNYVYVLGGGNTNSISSVERAAIQPDGDLDPFASAGVSLAAVRQGFGAAVIGDYLYVFGGHVPNVQSATVERAPILANGNLGAFTNLSTVTLATAVTNPTAVQIGNRLYVLGGSILGGSSTADVQRALLQ